jgi:3-oxoacyl-[acyl-carrier-protein] synthase III
MMCIFSIETVRVVYVRTSAVCDFETRFNTNYDTKMAIFRDVAPCVVVDTDQRNEFIALKMEALSFSETSVNIYYTARCYSPP